jgi:hypothetical protein
MVITSIGALGSTFVEYVESEKKCYHEIVMAVPNLRNAAEGSKKP